MKLTTKDLNSLKPVDKMKRITISNSSLVVEVKRQGLTMKRMVTQSILIEHEEPYPPGSVCGVGDTLQYDIMKNREI